MTAVLDVSAAIDVVLRKGSFAKFSDVIRTADVVVSPEIYISETANVAWKYHRRSGYTHEQAADLAETGILLVDRFIPVAGLWQEALYEALLSGHPVYDLLYLVSARRSNGILLTRDKKLVQLCDKLHIQTVS
jgi:predicted nucleic acid-binding protein